MRENGAISVNENLTDKTNIESELYHFNGTIRLQFGPSGMHFDNAYSALELAAKLGTGIYLSPILTPEPGSEHGYNVLDHESINPEIGGEEAFLRFAKKAKELKVPLIMDIVPNHMAASEKNKWLEDVFLFGQDSEYNDYFDIDWNSDGRIHFPILGGNLSDLVIDTIPASDFSLKQDKKGAWNFVHADIIVPLKAETINGKAPGELTKEEKFKVFQDQGDTDNYRVNLHFDTDTGKFLIKYYDHYVPLRPESYQELFEAAGAYNDVPEDLKETMNFEAANAVSTKQKALALFQAIQENAGDPGLMQAIQAVVGYHNHCDGRENFLGVISRQHFKLSHWVAGLQDLNYGRFFNINGLIKLNQKNPNVFEATHAKILELVKNGWLQGLRVDHPDGMAAPREYSQKLRQSIREIFPSDKYGDLADRFVIVVEKITAANEQLPVDWQVDGTTGYDALNVLTGLFTNANAREAFKEGYTSFTGDSSYSAIEHDAKLAVMLTKLSPEINRIGDLASKCSELLGKDYGKDLLKEAAVRIVANMDAYRFYPYVDGLSEQDRMRLDEACARAGCDTQGNSEAITFIKSLLTLEYGFDPRKAKASEGTVRQTVNAFRECFCQNTGPVAAKGVEDMAFYRYVELLALNEVGGDPNIFGRNPKQLHDFNSERMRLWPKTMNATQTHDTKRGPLTRALINALTNDPEAWFTKVNDWHSASVKRTIAGTQMLTSSDEYMIYQTVVGALPFQIDNPAHPELPDFISRLKECVVKSIREAHERTTWTDQDTRYENACMSFIDRLFENDPQNTFPAEAIAFQKELRNSAMLNLAAQQILQCAMPGTPDIYQGQWLTDFAQSMVDPDNRRTVGQQVYTDALAKIESWERNPPEVTTLDQQSELLLYLLWKSMNVRQLQSALFAVGDYTPLKTDAGDNIVAFQRTVDAKDSDQREIAVIVTPRMLGSATKLIGGDLKISGLFANCTCRGQAGVPSVHLDVADGTHLQNVFTGESHTVKSGKVSLADVFAKASFAMLIGKCKPANDVADPNARSFEVA